jgi:hypothetical protein
LSPSQLPWTSLPGLTEQSILSNTLVKIDGYAGQARV